MIISIVIPFLNERKNLELLYPALLSVTKQKLKAFDIEFVFVDDGSSDGSGELVRSIAKKDKRVRLIEFTKNFGKEMALTAGIEHAIGDAIITMDADMQHPVDQIPAMVEKWQSGFEVVVGIRKNNPKTSLQNKLTSKVFGWLFSKISDTDIAHRETDFRLISRQVASEFLRLSENHRMARTLISWLGFEKTQIEFEVPPRANYQQRYTLSKRMNLAQSSIISHSYIPLKLISLLGISTSLIFGIVNIVLVANKYVFADKLQLYTTGTALLATIIIFLVGILLTCMGLIAMYIEHIHTEIIKRPLYVVKNKTNIK